MKYCRRGLLSWPARGPAPHGAGGLKSFWHPPECLSTCPAPHGAGGLKSNIGKSYAMQLSSRPARGGWIEISKLVSEKEPVMVPPRTGRVD